MIPSVEVLKPYYSKQHAALCQLRDLKEKMGEGVASFLSESCSSPYHSKLFIE
jgi:hypothetical protein